MSITASNNPFPHDPDDLFHDKLDRGGYEGTAQNLKDEIDILAKPDGFLVIGDISKVGNVVSIPNLDFTWRIDLSVYTNAAFSTTIVAATEGYKRKDIIVATKFNTFVKIQGEESLDTVLAPDLPDDTLFLTEISVFGSEIEDITPPINIDDFITKSSKSYSIISGVGIIDKYISNSHRSFFKISQGVTGLKSVDIGWSYSYFGKKYTIKNETTNDVTLFHNQGTGLFKFNFSDAKNLILRPNEIVEFEITYPTSVSVGVLDYIGVVFAPKDTPIVITTSTATVADSWEGRTIQVKANCVITVPNTLTSAFNSVAGKTRTGFSVTWAIASPFTWEITPTATPQNTTFVLTRYSGENVFALDQ